MELGETDDIIVNSHETYQERKLLFDHMQEVSCKRLERQNSKKSKTDKMVTKEDEEEIYKFYADLIHKMNDNIANDKVEGAEKSVNIIEEQNLRVEDEICFKFGIKPYQLKNIASSRQ